MSSNAPLMIDILLIDIILLEKIENAHIIELMTPENVTEIRIVSMYIKQTFAIRKQTLF